jgi:hypothetical protein
VSDAELLRVMATSSCSKQQKNTTEELGESSMVIPLSLNFPYENQKCPLMFFPAGQDLYDSLALPSSSNHFTMALETSSRPMKTKRVSNAALHAKLGA